ncbi:MAG: AAA family ATPase [Kiritimatiellae bacterium]|nr:AAA family ATPase [Kiritimatiellia bacterium]
MFIGRDRELASLEALWRKSTSSMVVVSGRRRIGKSTLVEMFASRSKCRFIEIEGLAPDEKMTNQRQLDSFCERLAKVTGLPEAKVDSWQKAFDALDAAVPKNAKVVVFLDEISWMGGYDPAFAAYLKNAWDMQLSKKSRLVLVVAGSVSAWIQDNILKSRAFVGRISLDVSLSELALSDCRAFWGRKESRVSTREMVDMLSVTGGIPKYLEEMDASLSTDENIKRLCFTNGGYLFKDFDSIFGDVFGAVSAKRRILAALSSGPASVAELSAMFGKEPNGHLSDDLRDLKEAGFVASSSGLNPATGVPLREVRYRLRDNYTRFYLKFIAPKAEAIRAGLFNFTTLDRLPGWESIMGLQFENLVLNNLRSLCPLIGLEGRLVTSAAPYVRRKGASHPGVQVDLLIQTPKSVYVVEVKRRNRISSEVEAEMQEKVARLDIARNVSVRTVLVYEGSVAPDVEEGGYFDYLVPIEHLLSGGRG